MNTQRFSIWFWSLTFAFLVTPMARAASDWNVAYLDQVLAGVMLGQKTVQFGDMEILVRNVRAWRDELAGTPGPRSAFDGVAPKWTDGNVFYSFDGSVSAAKQQAFIDAATEWTMMANLRFIARTTQANYMMVSENGWLSGGQSAVGMIGGPQMFQIGPLAWNRETLCHEIGHTLGLVHEQSRSDRDSYVTILTNNVIPGQVGNFVKLSNSQNQGAYDFFSVMHYARNFFSINPATLNTIEPLPAYAEFLNRLGQSDPLLTPSDRAGMAAAYGAPAAPLSAVVTNTADSGPGTLRGALYYGFDNPGATISFNIPVSDPGFSNDVFNILPTDGLPALVRSTIVDATTQPNSNLSGPEIFLNGERCVLPSTYPSGIKFGGSNCTSRGFIISGFPAYGVVMDGVDCLSNTLVACYVGVNPSGTAAVTNGVLPVQISGGAQGNTVGGTLANDRNVISGSHFQGLVIRDAGTRHNTVCGNYIGPNAAGTGALSNRWSGIQITDDAQSNRIGGPTSASFNIISGNGLQGIAISGTNTTGNAVDGNYIGLNSAGTAAIPNGWSGVDIFDGAWGNSVGSTLPGVRNMISGNVNYGIAVSGNDTGGTLIQGNLIGLNATGTAAAGNAWAGIGIFSGSKSNRVGSPGFANVISGNGNQGVVIASANTRGNVVSGNYIGVNAAGTAALPNQWSGVNLFGGADSNVIGGTAPGAENLISGNNFQGVLIQDAATMNNSVQGNVIGLNVAGNAAIANGWSGVEIYNGPSGNLIGGGPGARNFISGNGNYGVNINTGSKGNSVYGNTIGLNLTNGAAVPNAFAAVVFHSGAYSNRVGGVLVGNANLIAGSISDGLQIFDSNTTNIAVRGNSIFNSSGVGIALYNSANQSAVAPVLSSVALGSNSTVVIGSLNSTPSTQFDIDFYSDNPPAGNAEGMTYLGSRSVMTSAGGTVNFAALLGALVPAGRAITASATDQFGNTSRLSTGVSVTTTSGVNDGTPNTWRAIYFGGAGTTTNAQSCNTCDADGDGMNNRAEFLAGTNPTNAASNFKLTALSPLGSGDVASFNSATGVVYRLSVRDEVGAGWWSILADQVNGTGASMMVNDPNAATLSKRFYRAEVLW